MRAATLSALALLLCAGVGCGGSSTAVLSPSTTSSPGGTPTDCRTSPSARQEISAAVRTVLSYDYRTLGDYPDRVRAVTTPDFYTELSRTFTTAVKPVAERYKAVNTADVTTVAYDAGDCAHPRFVVDVTQNVSNMKLPKPRVDRVTVKVSAVFTNDRYLIAGLETV